METLAAIADSFTQNEIVSSNEFRAVLGFQPVNDKRADALLNKNINPIADDPNATVPMAEGIDEQQGSGGFGQNENQIDVSGLSLEEAEEYLRQLEETEKELDGMMANGK